MTTIDEVMPALEAMGSPGIKKVLLKHGVKEPFFGVKVEQLKTIQKKTGKNYALANQLYATGNADAMYLAGLITDDLLMTKADLQRWVAMAVSNNISEYTVPWVAAGSRYGFELALEWIDATEEHVAAAGWATLSNLVALTPDADLDLVLLKTLLHRVAVHIHTSPNRVRSAMNGFMISAGTYVPALTDNAIATADEIGTVTIDTDGTACKVPVVAEYIAKAKAKSVLGKKKKTVKC